MDKALEALIRKLIDGAKASSDTAIADSVYEESDYEHIEFEDMVRNVRLVRNMGNMVPPPQVTKEEMKLHRAQYRFAPLNETIVTHEVSDRDLPKAGNLSAVLKVRWVFDTPVLVGEEKGDVVGPIKIGDRWAIPGSTLRGLIRSVVETAAFGRLGRFNPTVTCKVAGGQRHTYSVGQVAARTGAGHLRGQVEGGKYVPDLAEALFGYVIEAEDGASKPAEGAKADSFARRGRVDFGLAWADDTQFANRGTPVETILGGPKASFAPFYLTSTPNGQRSWSDPQARLAGRKRFLPRYPGPDGDMEALKGKLYKPIQQFKETSNGKSPGKDVTSRLSFLTPATPGQSAFDGEIRLHNVCAVEIGAIIWALTWGGDDGLRHMIGRARGFGAGQARAVIDQVRVTPNAKGATTLTEGDALAGQLKAWRDAFVAHMQTSSAGAGWLTSETIKSLLASADPKVGQKLANAEKLDTLPLKGFAKVRDHPGGQRLLKFE